MNERLRYRIAYGVLGIGEAQLSIEGMFGDAAAGPLLRATGSGQGAILGFGRLQDRVDTAFDPHLLASRRWTSQRTDSDGPGVIRDVSDQARPGELRLTREREGAPAARQRARMPGPTFDPVGFLLRVRAAPPSAGAGPQVLQVLDGQALWRVSLSNTGPESLADAGADVPPVPAIRIQGRAEPIQYSGAPDEGGDRTPRDFVLWLSDDAARVPLRLEMPLPIGNLVVSLVEARRQAR